MIGAMFETNVKYELLNDMFGDYLKNIKYSNNVNVIIDLKSVIKKAYRMDLDDLLPDQTKVIEEMASNIINMIGHYRNWLFKNNKYSTFYIFYSTKECEVLKKMYPNYKSKYYNKYLNNKDEYLNMNNITKTTVKLIKNICKYTPHTYFIDSSLFDEFVYINHLIRKVVGKNDLNLILSSDPVLLQVLDKRSFYVDMKGMNTSIVSEKEALKYLSELDTNISGNLLNIILSIAGCADYSVNNIEKHSYKKALRIIEKLFEKNLLVDKTYLGCPDSILCNNSILAENIDLIKTNFSVIYPIELQLANEDILTSAYHKPTIKVSRKQFIELNNKVFPLYQIDINMLLKGEDVK